MEYYRASPKWLVWVRIPLSPQHTGISVQAYILYTCSGKLKTWVRIPLPVLNASLTQLVECRLYMAKVASSSLAGCTIKTTLGDCGIYINLKPQTWD